SWIIRPLQESLRCVDNEMLETVRVDAELLRVVTSAIKGAGRGWLRRTIDHDRESGLPFRCARAEVMAGMAGIRSHRVIRGVEQLGWQADSAAFALKLEQSRDWLDVWYRRFRLTDDPSVRVGAWLNLVSLADIDFLEVRHDTELHYSDPSRLYERAHASSLKRAVESRQEAMKKSLLGLPLPSANIGWALSYAKPSVVEFGLAEVDGSAD